MLCINLRNLLITVICVLTAFNFFTILYFVGGLRRTLDLIFPRRTYCGYADNEIDEMKEHTNSLWREINTLNNKIDNMKEVIK